MGKDDEKPGKGRFLYCAYIHHTETKLGQDTFSLEFYTFYYLLNKNMYSLNILDTEDWGNDC